MQNKHKYISKTALSGLELILLFLILCGAAVQVLLGQHHIFFLTLRLIYAPGMVFLAGLLVSRGRERIPSLLVHAAVYASLFMFLGLCNQVLLNHKNPFLSVVRLITMVRLPAPSEMFFTAAVLFLCSALTAKYIDYIYNRKRLLFVIGFLSVFISFFPSDIFGYPIIGVFLGCDTYDCIALLPYLCYFIAGIFMGKASVIFSKKMFTACFVITLISAVLIFTPLRQAALILTAVLPVYLLFLFSIYCSAYQELTSFFLILRDKGICLLKKWYQDFMSGNRNVRPLYFIVYTIMFLFMSACVFFSFIEFDNSLIWIRDGLSLYVPRIYYFSNYIHECIAGLLKGNFQFPSYSFRIGLGNVVPISYEPVYWFSALFNPSNVEITYNFMTLLRLFLAGLSASIFFLYHKRGYFESLIGSMMYTFCGFAIYAGVLHAHFIAPMIFLPLLMVATEEIFRKERWYLCTVLVAVALPANYYFIYMSTIAMGIYYIGRFLFTKDSSKKTWKYFFTTTVTFACSYLLGVVIGNISLFTSFASFVGSGRVGDSKLAAASFFHYGGSWLVRFYTYFISAPGYPGAWLKLGFIPLSYIAVIILLIKKGNGLLKFLFLLCTAFCIFPVAAFVMGGFSTITNRWCYIFALLISFITVWAIPEFRNLTRRELKILFVSLLPYVLIILMSRDYRTEYTLASLVILLGNYVVILGMNKELRIINKHTAQAAFLFLCCTALTLNAYYQYHEGPNTSEGSFVTQGQVLDRITDTPMKILDNYPDDSFYRVSTADIPQKNFASSLVMNYNSIATASSTMSSPIMDYNARMGNTTWSLVLLAGFDNRTFMNALACVKYYALSGDDLSALPYGYEEVSTDEKKQEPYQVYKNNYALPLGYTYDTVISENSLDSYDTLERQELMLQSAVLEDTGNTHLITGNPASTAVEAKITDYKANGITIKENTAEVTEPGATLTLTFEGLENSETYLVFDGILNPRKNNSQCTAGVKLSCDSFHRSLTFRSINHIYNTGQESYLYNLGYRKDAARQLKITFKDEGIFTFDSFKIYCQPMDNYASYIDKLTENKLENVKIQDNTITGDITVDKEKILVLSIPYQKGWTAYVDGKETDIQKANLMYSGIFLDPGEHDIKFVFRRPGTKASLCLSAVGIVIFIIALIIRRRRIKIKK